MASVRTSVVTCILLMALGGPSGVSAQTFSLTVSNGYGSGTFRVGDTVHIWSRTLPPNAVFYQWVGDIGTIDDQNAWHATLRMPAANITVTATSRTVTPWSFNNELIQGADTLKRVYWYFPTPTKGVIYGFHGTNGSASNFVSNVEVRQILNEAVADSFGVIVTESEESTKHRDLNGDGVWRWSTLPLDSTSNVDMKNIKVLTDTLVARGRLSPGVKRYALGYSNGGFFSQTVSGVFHFPAAVSYCGQGIDSLFSVGTTRFHWCMGKYDENPDVGQQGDAQAFQSYLKLLGRGICANYFLHDRSPLYPQRFMRIAGIDSVLSLSIAAELHAHNILDSAGYFRFQSDSIETLVIREPSGFPALRSLTSSQRDEVSNQIDVMCAGHQVYSENAKEVLSFMTQVCSGTTGLDSPTKAVLPRQCALLQNYPNPFNPTTTIRYGIPLRSQVTLTVFNNLGQEVAQLVSGEQGAGYHEVTFDGNNLASGVYFYRIQAGSSVQARKLLLLR
jgi:hypothetical protein